MPDDAPVIPGTPPTPSPGGSIAVLADPDTALSHDSARLSSIDQHRLAAGDELRRYLLGLVAWLIEVLEEMFGPEVARVMFDQDEGPFGGYVVRLLAVWDHAGTLLWRGPCAEHLERELQQQFGDPWFADVDARSRDAVETLIDRIQSAEPSVWFPDVLGLHLNEEGFPLPRPEPCPLFDVCEIVVADQRAQIARVQADGGAGPAHRQQGQAPVRTRDCGGFELRTRHTVRILGPDDIVLAAFDLADTDALCVEVDGREYAGVRMPGEDSPTQVIVWADAAGDDNMTFTPPGVRPGN